MIQRTDVIGIVMAYPQRSHYIQVAQQGVTLLILLTGA